MQYYLELVCKEVVSMKSPVGNVLVGVGVNVLLRQTEVHDVQRLVFLHTRPATQCSFIYCSAL